MSGYLAVALLAAATGFQLGALAALGIVWRHVHRQRAWLDRASR